jgi:hypothetical protein
MAAYIQRELIMYWLLIILTFALYPPAVYLALFNGKWLLESVDIGVWDFLAALAKPGSTPVNADEDAAIQCFEELYTFRGPNWMRLPLLVMGEMGTLVCALLFVYSLVRAIRPLWINGFSMSSGFLHVYLLPAILVLCGAPLLALGWDWRRRFGSMLAISQKKIVLRKWFPDDNRLRTIKRHRFHDITPKISAFVFPIQNQGLRALSTRAFLLASSVGMTGFFGAAKTPYDMLLAAICILGLAALSSNIITITRSFADWRRRPLIPLAVVVLDAVEVLDI